MLGKAARSALALIVGLAPSAGAVEKAAHVVSARPGAAVSGLVRLPALSGLSIRTPDAGLGEIPNPTYGPLPARSSPAPLEAVDPRSLAPAGLVPEAEAPLGQARPASGLERAPAALVDRAGEFSGLRRGEDPSEPVWSHAEKRGFQRTDQPSAPAAGEGGARPAALGRSSEPAEPPSSGPPPSQRPPRVFTRGVLGFFSSFALIQVAVESLGLAVPQMSDPLTQGFIALGTLSSVSYVAYSIGSLLGGRWVERFGIKRVYRVVLGARTLIWAGAALLFDPGGQTVPIVPLIALFSLDYFAHSIGRVAEHTLQAAWFSDAPAASSRFGTARDFVEYSTVFAMLGTGLIISAFGFGAIVYATPMVFGLAALISLFLKSLPDASVRAEKISLMDGFKGLFGDKGMLKLFIGQTLINNFFYLLYYMTATAFSVFVAHGDKGFAAQTASALTGVYGIGALLGTLAMTVLLNRMEKRTKALPESERSAAEAGLLLSGGSRWLKAAALALLGAWAFVSLTPVASLVWPIFLVSPVLLVIGFTSQIALNHLDPVMKGLMPADKKASIIGAARALTNLSYALSFTLWGGLFQWLGSSGFIALGIYSTLIAGAYLWLARGLGRER